MNRERVMLLIDADNVSVGVMEQAVALLHQQHGGLHVRRAYCTAESAVKHQAVFKRLGIKPMVNLAAGKNSTDIALAVDAMDLVLSERPDVVVIASSDSDFAPLVLRLREKGCRVRGIGQQGKTGDETRGVYDDYTEFEHKLPRTASATTAAGGRVASRATPRTLGARRGTVTALDPAPAPVEVPAAATPLKRRGRVSADSPLAAEPSAAVPAKAIAASKPRGRRAAPVLAPVEAPAVLPDPLPQPSHDPLASAVLACLPELSNGKALALNVAVQRLREAKLLGRNRSSAKLFEQLAPQLELLPAKNPSQVRLRRA